MNNYLLTIVIPTLNNEKDIQRFFESIKNQDFPKNKLEIIISDGGSTDNTLKIAKKFKAKVINNPDIFPDPGVNRGIKIAKGKYIMVLASDNIYKSKNSLKEMIAVFDDNQIYAAFPKQTFNKKDSIFSKYINTFTDPASHFIHGYSSNPRTFYKLYSISKRTKKYIVFDYKSNNNLPLVSFAQGFVFRQGFERSGKNKFDDIAPVMEMIKNNKQLAYVYSVSLDHHTINNLFHFAKKQASKTKNYLNKKNYGIFHREGELSKAQKLRIKIWPIYSLTILPPFLFAFYHLIKDKEKMWIFHPFLCIISAYVSLFVVLSNKLSYKQ